MDLRGGDSAVPSAGAQAHGSDATPGGVQSTGECACAESGLMPLSWRTRRQPDQFWLSRRRDIWCPYRERMPRNTLTRDKIVMAAIDLLDSVGLEGMNIRALGARLGSAATAIYWHVGSKDHLIALAVDQAWNEVALPDLTETPWRDAATAIAVSLREMLARHPWVLQAFGQFLLYGTGKARHDDHVLAIYEAAGLSATRATQAASAVFTFVLGNALGTAAQASLVRRLERGSGHAEELLREHKATAAEIAMRFPRLRARRDEPSKEYGVAPEGTFELGLRLILDGLQAELAT